jgi:hypothetical protein
MDLFRSRSRWHPGALLVAVASSTPSAQQDEWAQFRGNKRLTGVVAANAAPVPATPKVLWTWDAGDAIDRRPPSPAISSSSAPPPANSSR